MKRDANHMIVSVHHPPPPSSSSTSSSIGTTSPPPLPPFPQSKENALRRISEINQQKCNIPQVLDSLEITVSTMPTLNLYLFELVQNSLDVGAKRIAITFGTNFVTFEHDGEPLGDTPLHVAGMSNVFQSTKSVETIGFMGFGFKTIYKRFKRIHVSDICGWKFLFDVGEQSVELSPGIEIYSRHWIGAVSPIWDDQILPPQKNFTTRFHLDGLTTETSTTPLVNDLNSAFFDDSLSVLAVLALKGLTEICIVNETQNISQTLKLSFSKELVTVRSSIINNDNDSTDTTNDKELQITNWRVFELNYVPDDDAVKSLCQSRLKNILALHGREGAHTAWLKLKEPHQILGLINVDEDGFYIPSGKGGTIFATLPLKTKVIFDINIQANWLLDLSRRGLRDVSTNAWQKCILANTAGLVANFIKTIPLQQQQQETQPRAIVRAFEVLGRCYLQKRDSTSDDEIDFTEPSWVAELCRQLEGVPFLPVLSHNGIVFKSIQETVVLPRSTLRVPEETCKLFGKYVLNRDLVNEGFVNYLIKTKILQELAPDTLLNMWKNNGIQAWWDTVSQNKPICSQQQILMCLWSFLGSVYDSKTCSCLECVPTDCGKWVSPSSVHVLHHPDEPPYLLHDIPLPEELNGDVALAVIEKYLPPNRLPGGWVKALAIASGDWGGIGRKAFEWISSFWKKVPIKPIISAAINSQELNKNDLIKLSGWIIQRQKSLITHILAIEPISQQQVIMPPHAVLLTLPYLKNDAEAECRNSIFHESPKIVDHYLQITGTDIKFWRKLFLSLKVLGPVCLNEELVKTIPVLPDYNKAKHLATDYVGVTYEKMADVHTTVAHGWKLWDIKFPVTLTPQMEPYIARWLESGIPVLEASKSYVFVEGYNRRSFYAEGKLGSANWIKALSGLQWIPIQSYTTTTSTTGGGEGGGGGSLTFVKPSAVTPSEASKFLSPRLVSVLLKQGLPFQNKSL